MKRSRGQMTDELRSYSQIETPYGLLIQKLDLPLIDGKVYHWYMANPFALLWWLVQHLVYFRKFFCANVRGEVGKVVLYEDEATPGNKLHWHNPREMLCWYWTLAQFPAWYRSRKHGWFVLGYIKTPILKTVVGGASGMAKQILHFLWSSTKFNFDKGIFLSYDDVEFKFRARLHCIIVDGLAEKKLCSLKGASGMKCCADCKNVLTGPPHKYKNHPYLRHYSCTRLNQFDLHTEATFNDMTTKLVALADAGSKKLKAHEKAYGLNYEPDALVFDVSLRDVFSPIRNGFKDPMHTLIASGGVAQHHISAFLMALIIAMRVTLEDVDRWCAQIRWPHDMQHLLSKSFFTSRVTLKISKKQASLRAFANETLSAITALLLFWEVELEPEGKLLRHGRCLRLLKWILDILFYMGDEAVKHAGALAKLMEEYGDLFLELYPIHFVKPKFHWMFHIPLALARFGLCLNCMAPERMHKAALALAGHVAASKEPDRYLLERQSEALLEDMKSPDMFNETFLLPHWEPAPELHSALVHLDPDGQGQTFDPTHSSNILVSKALRTRCGTVKQGALVLLHGSAIGQVQYCGLYEKLGSGSVTHFIVYRPFSPVGAGFYKDVGCGHVICSSDSIQRLLPYYVSSSGGVHGVHPLLPWAD